MRPIPKIIIAITVALIIIISVAMLLILPKYELSENENRYLQKPPIINAATISDGSAMEDIELYINDHFPWRDTIVGIKSTIEKSIGKTSQNGIYMGKSGYLIQQYDGYDQSMMDRHSDSIDAFAQSITPDTYMILAPNSNAIYSQMRPAFASDSSQTDDILSLYSQLDSVQSIDIGPALMDAKHNHDLYYRLDHHWSVYGAYTAYLEFCDELGIEPYEMDRFDIECVTDDFDGTYYSKSTYYSYPSDSIDVMVPKFEHIVEYTALPSATHSDSLYFDSHLSTKDKYSYFLDGNQPLITITNHSVNNNESIAVVKDSYANIFVPFLTYHYEHVYVIDMRYFGQTLSEYIAEQNIDEVLFLYNIQTIRNDMGLLKLK